MGGMATELQRLWDVPYAPAATAHADHERDFLDAHFAQEVLKKLPKIVSRVSTLDALDLPAKVPDEVRQYFGEAHRCYLYGFSIACAVLCRALLESSLANEIDPKGMIKKVLDPRKSYVFELAKRATNNKRLADTPSGWVEEIKCAGDKAIHNLKAFKECWEGKPGEVLDKTRKVLEDLYGSRQPG